MRRHLGHAPSTRTPRTRASRPARPSLWSRTIPRKTQTAPAPPCFTCATASSIDGGACTQRDERAHHDALGRTRRRRRSCRPSSPRAARASIRRPPVGALDHVVDGERRDACRDHRLHLDPRPVDRLDRRPHAHLAARASSSKSTAACVVCTGWHSGMSSGVRFAARMPATRATASTSPFAAPPAGDRLHDRARRPHARARHGAPRRRRLGADVDHVRLAPRASGASGAARRQFRRTRGASFSGLRAHFAERVAVERPQRAPASGVQRARADRAPTSELARNGRRIGLRDGVDARGAGTARVDEPAAASSTAVLRPGPTTRRRSLQREREPPLERQLAPGASSTRRAASGTYGASRRSPRNAYTPGSRHGASMP